MVPQHEFIVKYIHSFNKKAKITNKNGTSLDNEKTKVN